MRSKNSKAFTRAESAHIEAVKSVNCAVCGAPPPSAAHHINQGDHFTTVALCWECHQGKQGIHGDRTLWRIFKHDELSALNVTLKQVAETK